MKYSAGDQLDKIFVRLKYYFLVPFKPFRVALKAGVYVML
jgi:hypothetical protein